MKKVFWAVIGSPSSRSSSRRWGSPSRPRTTTGNGPLAVQGAQARAALPPLPAEVRERKRWNDRGQVRRAAVRLHRRAGQERRLRRRDRALVLALRVRPLEPVSFTCITTPAREASPAEQARRPRDRDLHLDGRPRQHHRLLAGLLQGDRAAFSSRTTRRSARSRTSAARRSRRLAARSTTAGPATASSRRT